jgi:hypothetical protein
MAQKIIIISNYALFKIPKTIGLIVVAIMPMADIIPKPIPETLEG